MDQVTKIMIKGYFTIENEDIHIGFVLKCSKNMNYLGFVKKYSLISIKIYIILE